MKFPAVSVLDAAFVFGVTGAALTPWQWSALFVGAGFFALSAFLHWRYPAAE